ncbi:hypothetical protein HDU96_001023 [Phlyctochytrium bullatum]|nr:hypothetical protein HDU96_001023 [Phlyctochytrium bullatum]
MIQYVRFGEIKTRNALSTAVLRSILEQIEACNISHVTKTPLLLPPFRPHILTDYLEGDSTHAWLFDEKEWTRHRKDQPAAIIVEPKEVGKVFSSGHDLREMAGMTAQERLELFQLCNHVMGTIARAPQVVIASVDGLATAAGCQLALSCDFAVASFRASFATPGVNIGLYCTTPGIPLARTAASPNQAFKLLATGEPIPALRASVMGLVTEVVDGDPERLRFRTEMLAGRVASGSAQVNALGKWAFAVQRGMPMDEAMEWGAKVMAFNAGLPDAKEGIRAFLEKKAPKWAREASARLKIFLIKACQCRVIASVYGHAAAAGCPLALSCDYAIASSNASFSTPGVDVGLFCTTPGIPLTRAAASPKQAFSLLASGNPIPALRASVMGLVTEVVDGSPGRLRGRTVELAAGVAAQSAQVNALGK